MDSIFEQIAYWQERQFGEPDRDGTLEHMLKEVEELKEEINRILKQGCATLPEIERVVEEAQDLGLFLATQLARSAGLDPEDVARNKLRINSEVREWPAKPDERGVFNHKAG